MFKPASALVFSILASLGACATVDRHGFAEATAAQSVQPTRSGFAQVSESAQPARWGFAEAARPERPTRWGFVDLPADRNAATQASRE